MSANTLRKKRYAPNWRRKHFFAERKQSARNWRSQIPDHRRFVQNLETRQRETRRSGSAPKRNAPKWKRAKEKRAELEPRQNGSRQSETRQTDARQSRTRQCGMTPLPEMSARVMHLGLFVCLSGSVTQKLLLRLT